MLSTYSWMEITLFADGFDDESFAVLAVEFGVEDLLPGQVLCLLGFQIA